MFRAFINALIIRERAFLARGIALKCQQCQNAPNGFRVKKMLVLFLFLFVPFCFFLFCFQVRHRARGVGQQARWRYSCRRNISRSLAERKTHRGKNDVFFEILPQGLNLSQRRLGRILTQLRRPRVYGSVWSPPSLMPCNHREYLVGTRIGTKTVAASRCALWKRGHFLHRIVLNNGE